MVTDEQIVAGFRARLQGVGQHEDFRADVDYDAIETIAVLEDALDARLGAALDTLASSVRQFVEPGTIVACRVLRDVIVTHPDDERLIGKTVVIIDALRR